MLRGGYALFNEQGALRSLRGQRGFTLLELMIAIALMASLAALTTVNLARPQTAASMTSIVDTLRADLRTQQLRAMSGDTAGNSSAQAYGVYVESNQYTLFTGSSYSAGAADNFAVTADTGITISTTLPSSQVVFTKGTGDVTGFTAGQNTITLSDSRSGDSKLVTLNRYGVVTIQ